MDTLIDVEKLDAPVGEEVTLSEVLVIGDGNGNVQVGTPYVENAAVVGEVVQQAKDKKIVVFKSKRRKGYKRSWDTDSNLLDYALLRYETAITHLRREAKMAHKKGGGSTSMDEIASVNGLVSSGFLAVLSPLEAFWCDNAVRTSTPEETLGLETITHFSRKLMAMSGLSGRISSAGKLASIQNAPTSSSVFYQICQILSLVIKRGFFCFQTYDYVVKYIPTL